MSLVELVFAQTGIRITANSAANDYEAQALIASLLALVARSDGGISPDENLRMVELLRNRFGLGSVEALDMVSRAAPELASHENLDEILGSVNAELSREQKEDLMLMVLGVIAADNQKDAAEMKLLATLIDELKLSDQFMQKVYERYYDGLFY